MIDAVLFSSFLSREKLGEILGELKGMSPTCGLVTAIFCSSGGDAVAAVEFLSRVEELRMRFDVKIYQASSTAAFLALALPRATREMKRDTVLGIHRGEVRMSPSQISPDGIVDPALLQGFRAYDAALVQTLKAVGLSEDRDLMAALYATDRYDLSAQECLRCGLVDRLF